MRSIRVRIKVRARPVGSIRAASKNQVTFMSMYANPSHNSTPRGGALGIGYN